MVATRRGGRVCSPGKSSQVQSSDVQATPSTSRRTRSAVKHAGPPTQHAVVDICSHLENVEGEHTPTSSVRRCTRASRVQSPEQPSTPEGFVQEADTSDVESCSSAVSEVKQPLAGSRRSRRRPCVIQEDDYISEVESCSSAISASKDEQSRRRSLRRKKIQENAEAGDAKVNLVLEAESLGSLPSELHRVTRSQRKAACTGLSIKHQADSELSDTDSYMSGVSGPDVSKSTSRRVTRSRRQRDPIPIHLDEASESSLSPASTSRRSRASGGKKAANVDASESQSCDSEGFESGPTAGLALRRRRTPKTLDSDSEPTNMQSPVGSSCPTRSRGTPCSSRAGSGTGKYLTIVLEKADKDTLLNDSILESTVIAEDADCTLLEGGESDGVRNTDPTSNQADSTGMETGVIAMSDQYPHTPETDAPACAHAAGESAVTVRHQQEALRDGNKDGNTSEMEVMQEAVHSSQLLKPSRLAAIILCRKDSEPTEETGAMAAADDTPAQRRDDGEDADQTLSSEQDNMGVRALGSDSAQQEANSSDAQAESIQTTSSKNELSITLDASPEQQPGDVSVNDAKKISTLLSSDEEDEEDEGDDSDGEGGEDVERMAGGESVAAATAVDGLFMIDTRPGQDTDEQYYMEKLSVEEAKEEEPDEEFLDEECDEDDEDEDANVLFSSRNPFLKEMSSRIDPGIRLKELGGLYINFDGSKSKPVSSSLQKLKEKKLHDEVMKKSVIGPDFEKKDAVPPYSESKQALKLKRRVEREKSTGDGWFNMKAPELSQELKGDLQVLKMRGSLDPKRFYKKNDRDGFPKFFQVGTVLDSPVDFYHSRIPKKDRKRTMVDELLADAEFRQKNKKKYQQIISEKAAGKRNKKNKVHKKKI